MGGVVTGKVYLLLLQHLIRSVYKQWHRYRIWPKAFNVMLLAVLEMPALTVSMTH